MKVKKSTLLKVPILGALFLVSLFILNTTLVGSRMSAMERELEAKKADLEFKMRAKGKVVYAIKDIPERTIITEDALKEMEIEQSKIPQDALTSSSLALGRVAKYGISENQIVSQHDLATELEPVIELKLDEAHMKKLKSIAGDNPYRCSKIASLILMDHLDQNSISSDILNLYQD